MDHPQLHLPEPLKVACRKVGQYQRIKQPRKKNGAFKRKGIGRWHRAVSTNLVKQNVLVPKEESSSESDIGFHESQHNQKKNLMKKVKTALGKMLSYKYRSKPASTSREGAITQKEALLSNAQSLFPRIVKELPSPKLFTKPRMRKLSQNATIQLDVVEAETEEITQGNTLLRARRTTKRLSVTSLPSGLQKGTARRLSRSDSSISELQLFSFYYNLGNAGVWSITLTCLTVQMSSLPISMLAYPGTLCGDQCCPLELSVPYSSKKRPHFPALKKKKHGMESILRKSDLTVGKLQMQVDDLIETMTDKSMKLLAQRHAELQQCEFLGDEILQSSKQFQRISKRTMRKYKLKNVCFPCTCCCF